MYQFEFGLFPRLWTLAPGHALRLRLTTQMPSEFCDAAYFGSEPCHLTTQQQRTLPDGEYRIEAGSIHLPLLPHGCYDAVAAGRTPTSNGVTLPLDWGAGYPAQAG